MSQLALLVCLAAAAADGDGARLLKGVEERYNRAKTIQVLFEQSLTVAAKPPRSESGELFLRKPGRMRWQYTNPAGKLFLSDGKDVYLYSPTANRVEKSRLKESEDLRAPLAFLLGRVDFKRDFAGFRTRQDGPDTWVVAAPKSDRLSWRQVEFLVSPGFAIRRLKVTGQDESVLEFTFERERVNPSLANRLFRFEMPAGAELVEAGAEK